MSCCDGHTTAKRTICADDHAVLVIGAPLPFPKKGIEIMFDQAGPEVPPSQLTGRRRLDLFNLLVTSHPRRRHLFGDGAGRILRSGRTTAACGHSENSDEKAGRRPQRNHAYGLEQRDPFGPWVAAAIRWRCSGLTAEPPAGGRRSS